MKNRWQRRERDFQRRRSALSAGRVNMFEVNYILQCCCQSGAAETGPGTRAALQRIHVRPHSVLGFLPFSRSVAPRSVQSNRFKTAPSHQTTLICLHALRQTPTRSARHTCVIRSQSRRQLSQCLRMSFSDRWKNQKPEACGARCQTRRNHLQ